MSTHPEPHDRQGGQSRSGATEHRGENGDAGTPLVAHRPAPEERLADRAARSGTREVVLILMGTLGRAVVPGPITGNTAEDVLRETQTAVLAVKPSGLVSPVVQ